ncbi:hypothetical protein HELRODRAFT_62313 [Helobdella robusta]|uniref:Centromere/kinetochore protein zw10 n=1 Tax=Helobdella robusta TaxID=6412 RepID=T1FWZ3_HELRO|nr:hypothetical protein HELRODRAFT_62313 [Helobdella robusta]ESO12710.1 hypothetical protein HELRODRAFT_62313 [Helobdella robusta]
MQLYKCIRGVIQLYINVVPMFHGHSIQTLPFIAALHHNNCMYMAHKLMSFQIKTRNILRQPVDYVEELQRLAVDHFLSLLQQQKANILQNLKSDFGFDGMSEHYETTLKSWRKVSLELQHLQIAWNGVLPPSLLHKSIGSLFNTSLEEVVNGITKLEDISEFDAQKLTDLTSVIEKDGIDLISSIGLPSNDSLPIQFLEVKLQQHIEFWIKLKELKFVLNARLMEIRDRWAAGKGPLADAFTKEEMDSLIRALFQNTEMRSAVLAVINRKTDY